MNTYWQRSDNPLFVAYLCFKTTIAVFKRQKVAGHTAYVERLPYTALMLARRLERGADVPDWWTV